MTRTYSIFIAFAALLVGCQQGGPDDAPDLDLVETEVGVSGTFGDLAFSSERVAEETFDIAVEVNGMLLTAVVRPRDGVLELDGFDAESGVETQMLLADTEALRSLRHALDELGPDVSEALARLRRVVGLWEQWSSTIPLRQQVLAEKDRSYTSICWALNSYQAGSHDCNHGDWWDDNTTVNNVYISMHGSCGAADGTNFWNGSWQCYEPDHPTNIEYAYGNCAGRCGAGCGSNTQFTWDCLDHDVCVRFGHSTASLWCDDDFIPTWDDALYAPNCL